MGRAAIHKNEFTPFGLWIKEYVEPHMTVTNIDYWLLKTDGNIVHTMLIEEKTNAGSMTPAQCTALRFLMNQLLATNGTDYDFGKNDNKDLKKIDFWGFYLLKFPRSATMPGPGMTLNGREITVEELQKHLSFIKMFCEGKF